MPCAGHPDFADHDTKRIGQGKNAGAKVLAIGFKDGAYLLHDVTGLAFRRMVKICEHVAVSPVAILCGLVFLIFCTVQSFLKLS